MELFLEINGLIWLMRVVGWVVGDKGEEFLLLLVLCLIVLFV